MKKKLNTMFSFNIIIRQESIIFRKLQLEQNKRKEDIVSVIVCKEKRFLLYTWKLRKGGKERIKKKKKKQFDEIK